jgi:hypothetical protein
VTTDTGARTSTLTFDEVSVGDALPELALPITRTLIVATAIASRDYQDVHHDSVLAVERGSKDIFMNILSTGPDGKGAVVVTVRGANGLGDHVTGTVRVLLPGAAATNGAAR